MSVTVLIAFWMDLIDSWENRQQCVDGIRRLRMSELRSSARMHALKAGLASIIPIQLLPIMSAQDMEMRTCGLPEVNLDFLKVSNPKTSRSGKAGSQTYKAQGVLQVVDFKVQDRDFVVQVVAYLDPP